MAQALTKYVILVMFVVLVSSVSGYEGRRVGGRTEVKDVDENKEVQDLGKFSVKEFNRQQQQHRHGGNGSSVLQLIFIEVVEAQKQVVAGIKYYLKIKARAGNAETRMFDSVVVVKPWLHESRELLSFGPSLALRVRK